MQTERYSRAASTTCFIGVVACFFLHSTGNDEISILHSLRKRNNIHKASPGQLDHCAMEQIPFPQTFSFSSCACACARHIFPLLESRGSPATTWASTCVLP
eukprot:m.666990 g.666990  ORF g.666990 m.666990 type:complete len:101 (+) comp22751_c0_seq27:685-987(+)